MAYTKSRGFKQVAIVRDNSALSQSFADSFKQGLEKAGIKVVRTEFRHNDLSDRGPDRVKATIQATVEKFLDEDEGPTLSMLAASVPPLLAPVAQKN